MDTPKTDRKTYLREYMREYRSKKNYDVNRWRCIHFCLEKKHMPNSVSIKKYNFTKEELDKLYQNIFN